MTFCSFKKLWTSSNNIKDIWAFTFCRKLEDLINFSKYTVIANVTFSYVIYLFYYNMYKIFLFVWKMCAHFLEQTKMYKFIDIQQKWDIAYSTVTLSSSSRSTVYLCTTVVFTIFHKAVHEICVDVSDLDYWIDYYDFYTLSQLKWNTAALYSCILQMPPLLLSYVFCAHTHLKLYCSYVVRMTAAANYLQWENWKGDWKK